jgi:hypothetical protein
VFTELLPGNALIKSVTISTEERQLARGTEREIWLDHSNHILRLNGGRLPRKVQNRKTISTTMTFIANVWSSVSRRHQNLTGFNMEIAENGYVNPLQCMDCFVIFVEGIKRERQREIETETVKRYAMASVPHLRKRSRKFSLSFSLRLWSHSFSSMSCSFCVYSRRIIQLVSTCVFCKYTNFQYLWTYF